jgi:putative restriction endonuclease
MDFRSLLFQRILNLNTWHRKGVRAPHQPLYLLLLIGRLQSGLPRLASFSSIQRKLKEALKIFGPPRRSFHPEYPFWHLAKGDDAICEIPGCERISLRPGSSNPSVAELVRRNATGGLRAEFENALRDIEFSSIVVHRILDGHFPRNLHSDVLDFFGVRVVEPANHLSSKEPSFRERIERAYSGRCCITRTRVQFFTQAPGLEAVHIRWRQAGGSDSEANGLLLNGFHAKLFTLGLFTISTNFKVAVSGRLSISDPSGFLSNARKIQLPSQEELWPSENDLEWHRSEVFKG